MGMLDIFKSAHNQPDATPTVQNPVQPVGTNIPATAGGTNPATPGTAPNGIIPPGTSTAESVPLDKYKELWNNTKEDSVDTRMFGDLDPKAISDAASKIDFTSSITPEQMAAIAAGGDGAVVAMKQMMQQVGSAVHSQSSMTSAQLSEIVAAKVKEQIAASLPAHVRTAQTKALVKENPILNHPAAAPMVDSLIARFEKQYPDASPAEIRQHAESFVVDFANSAAMHEAKSNPKNSTKSDDTDWEAFFANP